MRDFKHLTFWQRSIDFSLQIYRLTQAFPDEERYGLTSQLRRAVTSIPINIAEGCGRDSLKDFGHFIHIAEGSASEVECELIIAHRLGYIPNGTFDNLIDELTNIRKMINTYKKRIRGS